MDKFINQIIQGDCLEVMPSIPDKSVDMILCDLPYGTTACKWDTVIPFEPLWDNYKRIIKDNGAIVLTASQPFTSLLITSNLKMFKYCWVWNKKKHANAMLSKYQPLKIHEDIAIFSKNCSSYYPLKEKGVPRIDKKSKIKNGDNFGGGTVERQYSNPLGLYNPKSIIEISNASQINKQHPTQKPVALFEYLIKTYTNEGEVVLDNCIGSGTTAVACIQTGRKFIGIEQDEHYCQVARERIAKADKTGTLFAM
jgi:site-specific DNA-methyltransferase (adenine-specific)